MTGNGRLGANELVDARIDSRLFGGSGGGWLLVLFRSAVTGLLISVGVVLPLARSGDNSGPLRSGDNSGPLRSGDNIGPFLSGDSGLFELSAEETGARGTGGEEADTAVDDVMASDVEKRLPNMGDDKEFGRVLPRGRLVVTAPVMASRCAAIKDWWCPGGDAELAGT